GSALCSAVLSALMRKDRRDTLFPYTTLFRSNCGPHLTAVLQPADRRFVSCTEARPEPFTAPPSHFLPSAASSPSHLPAGHGEKFRRTLSSAMRSLRFASMDGGGLVLMCQRGSSHYMLTNPSQLRSIHYIMYFA